MVSNRLLFLLLGIFIFTISNIQSFDKPINSTKFDGVHNPRVTIITSVYKGSKFIPYFLNDIVKQSIFNECELLIFDANSPENEKEMIFEYMHKYPNITYIRLAQDPGLYGVWNLGVLYSKAPYLTNANIDDRLDFLCYEIHAAELDKNPDIDLVYSGFKYSTKPNETFIECIPSRIKEVLPFSIDNLKKHCLPNNHPMWRKSLHKKAGLFDPTYKVVGDYDMWIRAALSGCVFYGIDKTLGLYYVNPLGLSSNSNSPIIPQELKRLHQQHSSFFKNIKRTKSKPF